MGHALRHGDGLGHVGPPQDVHGVGGDGAVVRLLRPLADPVRRQQPILPHQPPDASGGAADPGKAQPRPDLAVALAGEPALGDHLLDVLDQRRVVAGADRAGAASGDRGCLAMAIEARPRDLPAAGDPRQAINPSSGGRDRPAHRLDLRRAKGAPPSRRAILSYRSSISIVIAPTLRSSRANQLMVLADHYRIIGKKDRQEHAANEARRIVEDLAVQQPSNPEWRRQLAVSHDLSGDILADEMQLEAALAEYRAARTIRERLLAEDAGNQSLRRDLSISDNRIGDLLFRQGHPDEALAHYRQALTTSRLLAH